MPPSTIPNDIYQHSLPRAISLGPTAISPTVSQLTSYGTHGLGKISDGTYLLLNDSTPWLIDFPASTSDLTGQYPRARPADRSIQIPFVMVTTFQPQFRQPWEREGGIRALQDFFTAPGDAALGGKNSLMPFRLTGAFELLTVEAAVGRDVTLKDVKGTVFGFWGPEWAAGASVTGIYGVFLGEEEGEGRKAGFVAGWEAKGMLLLEWGVSGRFHLGLPRGEKWEALDCSGR